MAPQADPEPLVEGGASEEAGPSAPAPKKVVYCGVCSE